MYGAFSYGSVPYGASGGVTPFDYAAMLESSREELVYTVEIEVWKTGGGDVIDRTTGTNIGNMTLNGGLAAAFNGTTTEPAASSARSGPSTGYAGKTLALLAPIEQAVVHGSSTNGYAFTVNATTTVTLYGKQGTAPASGTDGMVLGSISFTDTSNESAGRTITSTDQSTVWDHVWVYVDCPTEPTAVYVGELVLYRSRQTTIRLGSAEWATAPTDVPASQPFDGRLTTALQWSRSIVSDRIGIDYTSGEATIAFLNSDGEYDDIVDGYAIDGRSVVVRVGRKTDAFANHLVIFRGVGVDWTADDDTVTVTARDKSFLLDVPAQPNVYAGTGNAEGGDDLTGKRKPIVLGEMWIVPPVLVDSTNLIYQVHSGPLSIGVGAVRDRAATLTNPFAVDYATFAALKAAVLTYTYETCAAEGFIRLKNAPSGAVTADATNAAAEDFPSAVRYIVGLATDIDEADLDEASFDIVAIAQTEACGRYYSPTDSVTAADVINDLMGGIGGWAGFNRDGKLSIGILTAPSGDPVATFARAEGDIIDLSREKLPAGVWPPPWRWRVTHWPRAFNSEDIAGAVTGITRTLFSFPYDLETSEDASILDDFPSSRDPAPVETSFGGKNVAAATAEASRLLTLFSSGYRLYRMTVGRRGLQLNLGDVITVTWPRYGLDAGKDVVIVGIEDAIDLSDGSGVDTVQLVVFG